MSTRKLVVLGTSAQVPTRERNQSGYFLYWDHHAFLVDPGEGTQRQLTQFNVKASAIDKILITHFHGDHCLGLPGVLQRMALDGVNHRVEVYFPASGEEYFERLRAASFSAKNVSLHPCPVPKDGMIHEESTLTLEARQLSHPIDTVGYRIKERDTVTLVTEKLERYGLKGNEIGQLKADGFIRKDHHVIAVADVSIPRKGQGVAFVMDTRRCENAERLAFQTDLLVCESTYGSEQAALAESFGHLTAGQAGLIARNAEAGHLILTHFSQRYVRTDLLLREAKLVHPHVSAASDGDVFDLPPRKQQATDSDLSLP